MMAGPSSSGEPKSIEAQLESLLVVHSDCCIYAVPENLRKVNEDAYRPLLVSIGPVYHGDENLADMQHQKVRYLQSFLERNPKHSIHEYLTIAKGWEVRAKRSYIETIKLPDDSSDEFAEMLLLDAVFIIELFMRNCTPDTIGPNDRPPKIGRDDRIYNKPRMVVDIRRDIRLEENQLPFFILRDLYTLVTESPSQQPLPSILDISLKFFDMRAVPEGINLDGIEHLVDFLRECHLPSPSQRRESRHQSARNNKELEFTSSVTKLSEAGVKFVVRENENSLLAIRFTKGVLEIPRLKLTDDMESLYRNIMAFEQCHHYSDSYFIDYVAFLNCLINTPEDVDILAKSGIIDNWLGNSEEVANLFSKLFKETRMLDKNFYYSDICRDLNAYSKTRWPRWRAILKRKYFNHPWAIIAVAYAILMLVLTVLQVATGFRSLKK